MGQLGILHQIVKSLKGQLSGRNPNLDKLQKILGYHFRDEQLLVQSISHKSIGSDPAQNYERLEFLGDAVLEHVISEKLFREFPEASEGILTKKRSALVRKSFLADMGNALGLIDYVKVSASVDLNHEKVSRRQLANVFEAIVGAMRLDGGLEPCEQIIERTIWSHRNEAWQRTNHKGLLIEYCQANHLGNPRFIVTDTTGPEHEKIFEVSVKIGQRAFPAATGKTKKAAEQEAAQVALNMLSS